MSSRVLSLSWLTLEGQQQDTILALKWGFQPLNHNKQKTYMYVFSPTTAMWTSWFFEIMSSRVWVFVSRKGVPLHQHDVHPAAGPEAHHRGVEEEHLVEGGGHLHLLNCGEVA